MLYDRLKKSNLQVKYVTNTTTESRRALHYRLTQMGFDVNINDIHSSLAATKNMIISKKLKPMLLLSPGALEDFEGLSHKKEETPNAIIVGLAPKEFFYERFNEAFRYRKLCATGS